MAQPVEKSRPISDDRSLGELVAELSRETTELVREEVSLAKTELSHKVVTIGKDVGYLVAGAAVAYIGLMALVAAAVIGLAHALPWWLSALLVGVLVLVIGGLLVWSGLEQLKRANLAPTETLQTIKEDVQWTKEQI